jgi:hypothetical protein
MGKTDPRQYKYFSSMIVFHDEKELKGFNEMIGKTNMCVGIGGTQAEESIGCLSKKTEDTLLKTIALAAQACVNEVAEVMNKGTHDENSRNIN